MLRNCFPVPVRDNELVDIINQELDRAGTYMSDSDIRENLDELEDCLEGIDFRGVNSVMRKLKNKLAKDKESDRRQGLYRSRHQFSVFCIAARHEHSIDLARELFRFLKRNADDIEDEEKNHMLKEWSHGLSQLRGLVDGDEIDRVARKLGGHGVVMLEGWRSLEDRIFQDREQSRHRLERYNCYDFGMRGLSVPGRRSTLTDLSYIPRTACHSPQRSQLRDEMDAIHVHQHLILHGIDNLQRQFDRLGHRY